MSATTYEAKILDGIDGSITENWAPPGSSIEEHQRSLLQSIYVVSQRMATPDDQRLDIALAMLNQGGRHNTIYLETDAGMGKNTFLDQVFGPGVRTDMTKRANAGALYGSKHPLHPEKLFQGDFKGLVAQDPRVYADELPQVTDTGDMHRLWSGDFIIVGSPDGKELVVPLGFVAIAAAGNYADGERNHKLDQAMLSRWSGIIMTGDFTTKRAAEINAAARSMEQKNMARYTPLLAPLYARQEISQLLDKQYSVNIKSFAEYLVNLTTGLNASGLVMPVSTNDMRLGSALQGAARAYLWRNEVKRNEIQNKDFARIAAIALPSVVVLNGTSRQKLRDAGGKYPTKREQAIALRRIIAHNAEIAVGAESKDRNREKFMKNHSYANAEAIEHFDIDGALGLTEQKPVDAPVSVSLNGGNSRGRKFRFLKR